MAHCIFKLSFIISTATAVDYDGGVLNRTFSVMQDHIDDFISINYECDSVLD
jgi:hypothetical protein